MKGEVSYFMSTRNSPYRLDMLVLSTLSKHDCYGYQLTQIFDECSNGIIKPKLLRTARAHCLQLIDQGYISSYEEIIKNNRRRVYYHLEPKGFELLQQLIDDYQKYTASIQSILNYK